MKVNVKMLVMATGFAMISGLVTPQTSAPATLDPDLTVYNAIKALGFTDTAPITLPADTDTKLSGYIDMLTIAQAFYTADGKATTAVQPYYGNITAWLTAVNARKTANDQVVGLQTAARTTLTEANGATDLTTLNSKINDANFIAQIVWLKANAATDLTNLYTKISGIYKAVPSQTKDSLGAYLDGLKTISSSITTNTTVFGDQTALKGFADAITVNADAAKTVVNIMNANLTTLDGLKTAIDANAASAKAWRKLKSLMPQ